MLVTPDVDTNLEQIWRALFSENSAGTACRIRQIQIRCNNKYYYIIISMLYCDAKRKKKLIYYSNIMLFITVKHDARIIIINNVYRIVCINLL